MSARSMHENIERYCMNRCDEYYSCINCKCDTAKMSCYLGFFVEICDVIDLKTLVKLSYYDIPDIYELYVNEIHLATTGDFKSWLLDNSQYKIIKKENKL